MALEPRRRRPPGRHAVSEGDLEWPLPERHLRKVLERGVALPRRQVGVEEAVERIRLPVDLLLEGDLPAPGLSP